MSDASSFRLGDLQLRIMRVLWRCGPLGVAEVRERLDGDDLAYTTVATMLRKMEDRGLVGHETLDRRFIYHSAVDERDVTRSMAEIWSIGLRGHLARRSATACRLANPRERGGRTRE